MKDTEEEKLGRQISSYLNTFNDDIKIKKLVSRMDKAHRTLKQTFMKFILAYLKKQADNCEKDLYDARDEDSVKLAKDIIDNLDDDIKMRMI